MFPHLPTAFPHDVVALDDVSTRLRAAGGHVIAAAEHLNAGVAASEWTGLAANAAVTRAGADALRLGRLVASLGEAGALVSALRGLVAVEAAAAVALEHRLLDALDRLSTLPADLSDSLRRAARLGGWDGLPLHGIPLPRSGSRAWHEAAGLFHRLLP